MVFPKQEKKKWHFCLQRGNSIRKPWKLNSSHRRGWRAVFFLFLLFRSHCIWLKMITKCEVFDVSKRHSLKKIPCIRSGKSILSMIGKFRPFPKETRLFSSKHSLNWEHYIVWSWIRILSKIKETHSMNIIHNRIMSWLATKPNSNYRLEWNRRKK